MGIGKRVAVQNSINLRNDANLAADLPAACGPE
ncbi:hypothetical protein KGM_214904A, partial [Danaus plexippus plexippus]